MTTEKEKNNLGAAVTTVGSPQSVSRQPQLHVSIYTGSSRVKPNTLVTLERFRRVYSHLGESLGGVYYFQRVIFYLLSFISTALFHFT